MNEAADSYFFSSLPAETHFYIVRHGQSEGNARGIAQGRLDLPLDGTGLSQAAIVGDYLAELGAEAILSSPLKRAEETARIVAARAGLPEPRICPELVEIDTGVFSGISFAEAEERFPEAYSRFRTESWEGVPGAEKASPLYGRALSAWKVLREAASGRDRRIVCLTHGGFIQWLVKATFGCREWLPLVPVSNCGITELYVDPRGGAEPRAFLQWRRFDFKAPGLPDALSAPLSPP